MQLVKAVRSWAAYTTSQPALLTPPTAYGIVSRVRDRRNGSVYAMKQIRILEYERNNGIPLTALREISILRSLRHNNVINLLEVAVDDNVLEDVYMVMEYCEQVGNLRQFGV